VTSLAAPLRRVGRALGRDLAELADVLSPAPPPAPGLHAWRFERSGGRTRLHLRVARDGSGALFRDVTDVIHLNATAVEHAAWALERVPLPAARRRVARRVAGADRARAESDLARTYALVEALADPAAGCPTCAFGEPERAALFATAIDAPYKADLAVTYDCNNDCPHCYNEAGRHDLAGLPTADWKRIVDRLVAVGVPHLIFTGGEATLREDLPELVAHADAAGPLCGLNTNGRRLATAGYAATLADAGLEHVQVTLGSHDADVHDRIMNARAFAQTVRGIERALATRLHVITNTTLTRLNADDIVETIAFLHALGIRTFALNAMIHSGGGFGNDAALTEVELAPILVRARDAAADRGMRLLWYTPTEYCRLSPVELELGAKRCNAGEYSLCVEPDGSVLPCQSYYVAAGNLLTDPWESIWRSELFRSFRDREDDPDLGGLPDKCRGCPDLPICGGGCRIQREAEAGVRVADGGGCSSGGCSAGGCSSRGGGTQPREDGELGGFVGLDSLVTGARRATGRFR